MKLPRIVAWLCTTYVVMLVVIIAFGIFRYGHLREIIPDQGLTSPPGALYWYSSYKGYLEITNLLLALLIGAWAALFGIFKGNVLKGIGFLGYSLLPRLYHLGGDLNAGGHWLTYVFYAYSGTWLLTTLLGTVFYQRSA